MRLLNWSAFIALCATSPALAQPGLHESPLSWDRNVRELFARHCFDCHSGDDPSGDIDLEADVDLRLLKQNRKTWLNVLENLQSGAMPPEDAKELADEKRATMIEFLEANIASINCEDVDDPGKPLLRRLNRIEYDNVVADLTGLELNLGRGFPPDPNSYGFDNIADSLSVDPAQVAMYHGAAEKIVDAIVNSKTERPEVYERTFGVDHDVEMDAEDSDGQRLRQRAEEIIGSFADRAFRMPAENYYKNRLLRIYDKAIVHGENQDRAIGHALTAVLISPRFLMRIESDQPDSDAPFRVSDFELANRLSFFLWSRGPDDILLELAAQGRLHDPDVLRQQMDRMLRDAASVALVDNFFFQWLDLRRVDTHTPDATVFPEFNADLRTAMQAEVRLLLRDIVQQDLAIDQLIHADFTYVNDRLAKFYQLEPVGSKKPVRVDLPDKRRGGILTSAAFLMVQSDPGRTNIPRRGNFIAAQILDDAPPPPPADVPLLDEVADDEALSLRQKFERHRSSAECKGCHAKIDPFGFSLENYDAIGRWRDQDGDAKIDASAEAPSGTKFVGAQGLKKYVSTRRDDFYEVLASRLAIYALGRGLQSSDDCVVQDMVNAAKTGDGKFSNVVFELIKSQPFTHRKNPEF